MSAPRGIIASIVALVAAGCAPPPASVVATDSIPELALVTNASSRLLVVAPHPDDEAIAAAGLIQRVKASGGSVRVALMTSGDAFPEGVKSERHVGEPDARDFRAYGNEREREAINAMQRLSVDRNHVLLLGFPDGGLCLLASSYISSKARAFASPYTRRVEPPPAEQIIRGTAYRGADIRRELESIVTAYQPTIVAFPHPDDDHPDHCATSIFMLEAINAVTRTQRGRTPVILQYVVHHEKWPDLDESPSASLRPPADWSASEGTFRSFQLTSEEVSGKRALIESYPTQLRIIGRFLRSFGRPNELFIEGRTASPPECWCDDVHVATEKPPEKYRRKKAAKR